LTNLLRFFFLPDASRSSCHVLIVPTTEVGSLFPPLSSAVGRSSSCELKVSFPAQTGPNGGDGFFDSFAAFFGGFFWLRSVRLELHRSIRCAVVGLYNYFALFSKIIWLCFLLLSFWNSSVPVLEIPHPVPLK